MTRVDSESRLYHLRATDREDTTHCAKDCLLLQEDEEGYTFTEFFSLSLLYHERG